MWQEYAIEPAALVRSLKEFNVFKAGLGWEHGRLLAKFPNEYKKLVAEALAASPEQEVKKATIESRLQDLFSKALINSRRPATAGNTWLATALAVHTSSPFHALITLVANAGTIGLDDFDPSDGPWSCCSDQVVPRTAHDLSQAAARLFNHSAHVAIIDPHFAPQRSHVALVLTAYLDSRDHPVGSPFELSIHVSRAALDRGATHMPMTTTEFEAAVRRKVSPMLMSGQTVIVHVWDEIQGGERFHDRYILSRHGGLSIQGGTDSGPAAETTTVSRVSAVTAAQILDRFARSSPGAPNPVYDQVHRFEIR